MATASLPSSCEEQQNNNLDEYSDDSDAESEKVRKAKKAKKPDNEKWSSSLICNLIDVYNRARWETRYQLATPAHCAISSTIMNYHGPFDRKHDSQ